MAVSQFQEIARKWAETSVGIEAGQRQKLIDSIGEGVGPRSRFLLEVRFAGREREWENHRKDEVLGLLADALSSLGFQRFQDRVESIRRALSVSVSGSSQSSKVGSLRSLLVHAIQRMPEHDLEKLNIPAGYLYKALRGD